MTNGNDEAFGHGSDNGHCEGLSKREYFAAAAMQGLLANSVRYKYIENEMAKGRLSQQEASMKNANKAVYLADALIEALNEGENDETQTARTS